ncbi:hypothetical protein CISG_08614 [Coccidioides immitis RMSCC 3703]|uniref:Uncharacterized protein n=1 Tax=Coccidioides immitis RMSCC 3703 TaxID=454286 RepID=A0A0J8R718_COCIT|nr:hypothetical protein CISG_08614 [Coccidioides immitis RMSCC 3703]
MPKLFNMVSPPGSSTDEPKSPYLHPSASSLEYSLNPAETTDGDDFVSPFQGHTRNDQRDMMRMGKNQEFAVRSIYISFASDIMPVTASYLRRLSCSSSWSGCFELLDSPRCDLGVHVTHEGLNDGGVAGLFWSYVWTFIGFGFCVYSMAEMASMLVESSHITPSWSPEADMPRMQGTHFRRQYHWVSEFASPNISGS